MNNGRISRKESQNENLGKANEKISGCINERTLGDILERIPVEISGFREKI